MTKFICKNCNYRFETKLEYKPKRCPYCNKDSVDEDQTAEKLLEEINDILK